MRKIRCILLIAVMLLAAGTADAKSQLMALPMVESVKIGDFDVVNSGESKSFRLPKMPPKAGYIPVLRCRMCTYKPVFGGGCHAAKVNISGTDLGAQTAAGEIRMLGKHPVYEMKSTFKGTQFEYFSANDARIDMPYGPSCDAIDADSVNGDASVYLFDLRDVLSGLDSNTVTFTNVRRYRPKDNHTLLVRDCEVGYISEKIIPPRASTRIAYEALALKRVRGDWSLEVGQRGGFVFTGPGNNQLIVESRLGMNFSDPASVLASDTQRPQTAVSVKNLDFGPYGVMTEVTFPGGIRLTRKLKIGPDGLLQWQEEYHNTGKGIAGVPFHHRLSLNTRDPRIWLSGEPEATFIPTAASHPTIVLEERGGDKRGFGLTLESDITRLISATKNIGDTAEVFSATLALAPGMRQTLEFSIDPIRQGGYWTFINRLRERWKLNTFTAERPLFLGMLASEMPRRNPEGYLKRTYGHLGPIVLALKPWRSGDHEIVMRGLYPKLPPDAPRAPGGTPDLDIEAYLTYAHRRKIDDYQKKYIDMIHRTLPNAKVVQLTHPSMETVYLPLQERWDYADCAIRDRNGEIYHLPHYDESHLKKYSGKGGWAIGYYVPYGGSKYYEKLLNDIQRGIDLGFDGLYIDEFSFVFERAGYSRYTYDRWDGFSADLGPHGEVLRLKSDNAYASLGFQHAAIDLMNRQGKYFLGNLMAALRSVNNAPALRFWESAQRIGWEHMDKVPTLLGHTGRDGNRKQIFEGVKEAMRFSCLYSPFAQQARHLEADNFICKEYPMTVIRLMPNAMVGRERIITLVSGEFAWPGVADGARARLFRYDADGNKLKEDAFAEVRGGVVKLEVPQDGMTIAELQ